MPIIGAGGMFRSKAAADIETVRSRLAEAEARIAPLERHLSDVSLECALSGNFKQAEKLSAGLASAREHVGVLRRAFAAAEAAEANRLSEARTKEQRSKLRAGKSHLDRLARKAAEYQQHVARMTEAWAGVVDAAEAMRAIIGPGWSANYPELSQRSLLRLGDLELRRAGSVATNTGWTAIAPGAVNGRQPSETPISATISNLARHYGEQLARELSLAPPLPPPVEGPDETWRGPTLGTSMWDEEREARLRQQEGEPQEPEPDIEPVAETQEDDEMKITDALRALLGGTPPEPEPAEPLPLNPWPIGSVEWTETEELLAADRAMTPDRIRGHAEQRPEVADTPEPATADAGEQS